MQILHGLPEYHRAAAADLYWQAFGDKLGAVMGPPARAQKYLHRVMRLDQCLGAVAGDRLLGIVGMESEGISFAGGTAQDMRAVYGWARTVWALPALIWAGGHGGAYPALMIDGFAVLPEARRTGIGAGLMQALCGFGRRQGYRQIELDVIDSNWPAQAFYQAQGFSMHHQRSIAPLHLIFGFNHAHRMVRLL